MKENPYFSKNFLINNMTKEERFKLKESLLGQTIKIIVNEKYGLFTEHGFPVSLATYDGLFDSNPKEFYAEVIETKPMVTIYAIQR